MQKKKVWNYRSYVKLESGEWVTKQYRKRKTVLVESKHSYSYTVNNVFYRKAKEAVNALNTTNFILTGRCISDQWPTWTRKPLIVKRIVAEYSSNDQPTILNG